MVSWIVLTIVNFKRICIPRLVCYWSKANLWPAWEYKKQTRDTK